MDLYSYNPYWLVNNGLVNSYPSLQEHVKTDVCIIGCGITGAITAYYLMNRGDEVAMLDKRHVGMGSTCASTALLQYEIDEPLHLLIEKVGYRNACESYQACLQAVLDLKDIIEREKFECGFEMKNSLQFASYKKDKIAMEKEYNERIIAGLPVKLVDNEFLRSKYGIDRPCGLLTDVAAHVDAYALTHQILGKYGKEINVFDTTEVVGFKRRGQRLVIETTNGFSIVCKKLVIAAGYESQKYFERKIEDLSSTYAIISKPLNKKEFWYRNSLIWETARPYLYMRTTSDNRIIVGGKDIPFTNPEKRDSLINKKSESLLKDFNKLFPGYDFQIDFKWAGTFAGTRDSLPLIGSVRGMPDVYFNLGFGGNGITFSVVAAKIIADLIHGKPNPLSKVFSFERL